MDRELFAERATEKQHSRAAHQGRIKAWLSNRGRVHRWRRRPGWRPQGQFQRVIKEKRRVKHDVTVGTSGRGFSRQIESARGATGLGLTTLRWGKLRSCGEMRDDRS
jgi:hypothetical protein